MRAFVWTLAVALLATTTVAAQEGEGRRRGGREFQMNPSWLLGPLLANAADADSSGDVSSDEWKAFTKSFGTEDKVIPADTLKATIFVSLLDRDGDRKIKTADFEAIFKELDRDESGALESSEMSRRRGRGEGGRRGRGGGDRDGDGDRSALQQDDDEQERPRRRQGQDRRSRSMVDVYRGSVNRTVAQAADGDKSGDVTKDEWKSFVESMGSSALSEKKVIELMTPKESSSGEEGEGRRRGRGNLSQMLDRMLEEEKKVSDVQKMFEEMDRNDDKAIQKEEMGGRRGPRREPV